MAIRLPPKTGSSTLGNHVRGASRRAVELELPDDRHGRWFDRGGVRARG
jgi:hypothetical protein